MKTIKKALVVVALAFGMVSMTQAQDKLVAHINTQELVQAMPSYQNALSEIEKLSKTYETQISELGTEYQKTLERYGREAEQQTDEENLRRQQELQETQQNIVQFQQNARQKVGEKQEELLKPVLEKARVTIIKVSKAKGFKYVFDSSPGAGLILAEGFDLMNDVKADLGI